MHFGRLLAFTVGIIGGSLLQLWILLIVLATNNHAIDIKQILGDGGLFFFSTSLCVASALNLFDYQPTTVGKLDFNMTLLICGGIFILTVVYYTSVLSGSKEQIPNPFSDYCLLQVGCALTSIGYWFFTGLRTGLFIDKGKQ